MTVRTGQLLSSGNWNGWIWWLTKVSAPHYGAVLEILEASTAAEPLRAISIAQDTTLKGWETGLRIYVLYNLHELCSKVNNINKIQLAFSSAFLFSRLPVCIFSSSPDTEGLRNTNSCHNLSVTYWPEENKWHWESNKLNVQPVRLSFNFISCRKSRAKISHHPDFSWFLLSSLRF